MCLLWHAVAAVAVAAAEACSKHSALMWLAAAEACSPPKHSLVLLAEARGIRGSAVDILQHADARNACIGGQDCVNFWVRLNGLLMVKIFTLCKRLSKRFYDR
jgi:hypothetical protein